MAKKKSKAKPTRAAAGGKSRSAPRSMPAAKKHVADKGRAPARAAARKPLRRGVKAGKMVYFFGGRRTEGNASMRALLGGKGANLADMTSIGLPVPPGFTITTESCAKYYEHGKRLPHGLMNEVHQHVAFLERETGKKFGDDANPLLVSVRSGAAVSMPGMMDTILNLGLNDEAVEGLARSTGNRRFAYDAYRRLINMFGDVVMGVGHERFEHAFDDVKRRHQVREDNDVPEAGIVELCVLYKEIVRQQTGHEFPQNPFKQLELAVEAVFRSWNADRAISYRRLSGIAGLKGTAVNVQAMVFGNMGDDSGTGVAFTRDPSTGRDVFYGEFLVNAQGEDVVAGIRTPQPVAQMAKWNKKVHEQLLKIKNRLEKHYREMQDIEFTIERGTLYMLQTRTGKRTGAAAVKIACDMVKEGLITEKEALLRIPAGDLTQLLLPSFDPKAKTIAKVIARGLPASPGASVGRPAFTADEAVQRARAGESVILVRKETSPEDVDGMHSASGILTSTGGMTSHAAVVARGWGKCCVAGAGMIQIDAGAGTFTVGGQVYGRQDLISLDGSTGEVIAGAVSTVEPTLSGDFAKVMRWADKHRTMGVRANADTPADADRARSFGAEGIGLCRTEHMFFEGHRITAVREMILAETVEEREAALEKLLPYQRDDFVGIFRAMKGLPVTVRLLDPPLHEFLPNDEKSQEEMASAMRVPVSKVLRMQVRAIVEAAIACARDKVRAIPEIMVPLVGTRRELELLRGEIEQTIERTRAAEGYTGRLDIRIGTMIEIPRACIVAGDVAEVADFFSFGTNDLTQLTFGYSRDDSNSFLPDYLDRDILAHDPFQSLDQTGVGELVRMGTERGRERKADLKVGVCGEHGGDPASVHFFHRVGLDYVSCSPFRVPIARLAAAQAAIRGVA